MSTIGWGKARLRSGPWSGFYLYASSDVRNRMNLRLEFESGAVSGEGVDGIGEFRVSGRCEAESGKVWLAKTYLACECCDAAHVVEHEGNADENGIWGTWTFDQHAKRGGFRIWPDAESNETPLSDETSHAAPRESTALAPYAIGFTGHSPFPEAI